MKPLKLVTIIGARPQFIKAATVSRVVSETPQLSETLVHTGQHYDNNMSDIFFEEMSIPKPAYHLGIGSGSHGVQTGKMLAATEEVLLKEKPDWLLVYGDTNSTLAGALAATKLHIPVAHVEAGLRSFNRRMPEEINRVLTDHSSDVLFPPTKTAAEQLQREGIPQERIHLVGDVMYDAACYYEQKAAEESIILKRLNLADDPYILATVHRADSTDKPEQLEAIMKALGSLTSEFKVILPLHPRTRKALSDHGLLSLTGRLSLTDPVGYFDMIKLEKNAALIVTDSGGVQKEAFFYNIPCVTLRGDTEWTETVEAGWNRLVYPLTVSSIITAVTAALGAQPDSSPALFGDGTAAAKIVQCLLDG